MFDKKLENFQDLPQPESQRNQTDVICTIIGAIYALALLIMALAMMNKDNYYRTNFPTDSDNQPCAYGKNTEYPYIYIPDIHNPTARTCVRQCPSSSDPQTECRTNSAISNCGNINIYQSSPNFARLGGFCLPDDDATRDKVVENLNLQDKWRFLNTYDIIRLSLLIALIVGLVWMIFVHCLPTLMTMLAIVFGSGLFVVAGIVLLIDHPEGWENYESLRVIIGAVLLVVGVAFFSMLFLYRRRIRVAGLFVEKSTKFLSDRPINFIFIPVFLLLKVGLIVLCMFQYLALSSSGQPVSVKDDIYLHSQGSNFLTLLVVIQFIWGLQFLKDTFNFIVSGNATEWYTHEEQNNCCLPISRLLKFNFGSVVGGSFLNAFFNFIDFIFEALRCYPEGCCGACASCCQCFSDYCGCFFDLVRNDAYAFINLTGIPYCNAARNCEVLCNSSRLFVGSQSVLFFYRLCAHIFCVGLTTMICYGLMKSNIDAISTWSLVLIILLAYCVVTYFIDIHADSAEGLQICYLLENFLPGGGRRPQHIQALKRELADLESNESEGRC